MAQTQVVTAKFDPSANTYQRTQAAHELQGAVIPSGAVITRCWYQVITTFTSAGGDAGTIKLSLDNATGDLQDAIAISDASNPYDAGIHGCVTTGAGGAKPPAGAQVCTAGSHLVATVAVQNLTGGTMLVFCEYIQGD